jgi:HAD superfamily hydrolase (TIGR01509 family)
MTVDGVVFDMDGVLIHTEHVWDAVREQLTRETGGRWRAGAQEAMMGLSSGEWSRFMHEELQVPLPPEEINAQVVERLSEAYRREIPAIDGASEAVRRLAQGFRLAVASSSNRPLIDLVIELLGVADCFAATVSSEEVPRGKPFPDVYLEAARQLGIDPSRLVAVEDSSNGLRAAHAAGLGVVAIPNPDYPPAPDALALAGVTLRSLDELDRDAVLRARSENPPRGDAERPPNV